MILTDLSRLVISQYEQYELWIDAGSTLGKTITRCIHSHEISRLQHCLESFFRPPTLHVKSCSGWRFPDAGYCPSFSTDCCCRELCRTCVVFFECRGILCADLLQGRSSAQVLTEVCRISWSIFTKIGTDLSTPKRKNGFVRGSISHKPFPYFAPQKPHFRPKGPENPYKY